jgi:hypothetical protein
MMNAHSEILVVFHEPFTDERLWSIQLLMNIPLARAPITGFSLPVIYRGQKKQASHGA